MLKWLSRLKSGSTGSPPRLRAADAAMQLEAVGRLPQDLAEGGRAPAPAPDYIPEAAVPSEDVWARERELYRLKQQREADS